MWICFNDGFISIVRSRDGAPGLMVRARKRDHLKWLFPDNRVHHTPRADYGWRVFVTETDLVDLLTIKVRDLDYANFKNSVIEEPLRDLYADFWLAHWRYQRD